MMIIVSLLHLLDGRIESKPKKRVISCGLSMDISFNTSLVATTSSSTHPSTSYKSIDHIYLYDLIVLIMLRLWLYVKFVNYK